MKIHSFRFRRIFLLTLSVVFAFNQGAWAFDQSHSAWARVLKMSVLETVHESRVDYQKIKNDPTTLNGYLSEIEALPPEQFASFSRAEKIAFLINAYNAFTVKLIVDHYPVKSIRNIGGLFSNPWKMKSFSLFGEKQNLDHIEHDILRKEFGEPRIHFALVCASKGCPALRGEPYLGSKLDEQLSHSEKQFLTDSSRNRLDSAASTLYLSSIFKWYGGDFEKTFGSIKAYLGARMTDDPKIRAVIESPSTRIEYLDYDWSLNRTN